MLTDAFDGVCARRWPYSPTDEVRLFWRRLKRFTVDNIADSLLMVVPTVALMFAWPGWWLLGLACVIVTAGLFIAILLLERAGRSRFAERVDVAFGAWYGVYLGVIAFTLTLGIGHALMMPLIGAQAVIAIATIWYKWPHITRRPDTFARAESHRRV